MMQPVGAVQIRVAALQGSVDQLILRVGATLGAKVLERSGDHGLLMLAGLPVVAKLPDAVAAGQRVRLQVTDATAEHVTLKLLEAPAAPASASTPTLVPPMVLPGGAQARLMVEQREAGAAGGRGGPPAMTLRYESPILGRLDVRIAPGAIAVHAAAGVPADVASASAADLSAAVARVTGRPVQVTVHPRTETVDVSA